MANETVLHQTLHGYKDGHQLLMSSRSLTSEQESQLLFMSDLSGSSVAPGFDSYLTGYPLSAGNVYCLARSWYANELPRPGCVWTHTLMIDDHDLARILDVRQLVSLFRRPQSRSGGRLTESDLKTYSEPVARVSTKLLCNPSALLTPLLIRHLYGSDRQIVVESKDSALYEDTVLALFNQQWPRLRRNFRFCTGALSLQDNPFDLAVGPAEVCRVVSDKTQIISRNAVERTGAAMDWEDWIQIAVKDIVSKDSKGDLRQFLWRFGPDYEDGRQKFRILCEIYLAATRESSAANVGLVLSAIAHFFPESSSSRRLKSEFFSREGQYSKMPNGEAAVLEALVSHPMSDCIPEDVAEVGARARFLAARPSSDRATEIAITARRVGGNNAERYIAGYAKGIEKNPEMLNSLPIDLVADVVARSPSLFSSDVLWRRSEGEQVALAVKLSGTAIPAEIRQNAIRAMIGVGAWQALRAAFDQHAQGTIEAAFEWIDAREDDSIAVPRELARLLADHTREVIGIATSGACGARSSKVLSSILDPRSSIVRSAGTKLWISAAESDFRLLNASDEIWSRVFFLVVGLSSSDSRGAVLVSAGFSAVYEAARLNRLEDRIWELIDPYLPWYLINWDRCARLVRGVVRTFLDRNWPVREFARTFVTDEQFARAAEEAAGRWRGERYLKRLQRKLRAGEISLSERNRRSLERLCG
jgi:hypothetical protein